MMINKVFRLIWELRCWYKARAYRDEMLARPYFWGNGPDDRKGYERYEAFRKSHGWDVETWSPNYRQRKD